MFDAEICDRVEFETLLNIVFGTLLLLLLLILGLQAAGAQQLKGPCSLVTQDVQLGPRYEGMGVGKG